MILDKFLQFDPSGTAITSTADSTNTLDLLNARDLYGGNAGAAGLEVVVTVGAALTGNTGTLTILVRTSADNSTYATLIQTIAIAIAQLTAGTVIRIPLPSIAANPNALLPRYIKLAYTVGSGPFTAGTIEADLVVNAQMNNPPVYAAGITVAN